MASEAIFVAEKPEAKLASSPFAGKHVMVVVCHQDDEILGLGGQLSTFGKLTLVIATDGAGSLRQARRRGFRSRQAYADGRRQESAKALALAQVPNALHEFGFRDLEGCFSMASIARRVHHLLQRVAPDVVVTHPFEGGHPDHDAVAFAVHWAVRQLASPPPLWEFTSYHRDGAGIVYGRFQPQPFSQHVDLPLSGQQLALKRRMLDCFVSQSDVVANFPEDAYESFRRAPAYDFTWRRPAESVGYDVKGWQIDEPLWRALAQAAQRILEPGWLAPFRASRMMLMLYWLRLSRRAYPDYPRVVRAMRALVNPESL